MKVVARRVPVRAGNRTQMPDPPDSVATTVA
jgi:hypothetical protein